MFYHQHNDLTNSEDVVDGDLHFIIQECKSVKEAEDLINMLEVC